MEESTSGGGRTVPAVGKKRRNRPFIRPGGFQLDMSSSEGQRNCFDFKRHKSPSDLKRLVAKSGESNVSNGVRQNRSRTFVGLFTMLVDAKWRWTWLVFFASFYVTWMIFAILFWFICFVHGDFDPANLPITAGKRKNQLGRSSLFM